MMYHHCGSTTPTASWWDSIDEALADGKAEWYCQSRAAYSLDDTHQQGGIFKGKNLLKSLERTGLITTEDSSAGCSLDDRTDAGYSKVYVSRRTT